MKRITIVVFVIMIVLCLAGCSKRGICESCGQKEELFTYIDSLDGEKYHLCQYCYNMAKEYGPSSSHSTPIPEQKIVIKEY